MQKMNCETDHDDDIIIETGIICFKIITGLWRGNEERRDKAIKELVDIVSSYLRLKNAAGN